MQRMSHINIEYRMLQKTLNEFTSLYVFSFILCYAHVEPI